MSEPARNAEYVAPSDDSSGCLHPGDAVKWNPYNGVVQCHVCGAQPVYKTDHDQILLAIEAAYGATNLLDWTEDGIGLCDKCLEGILG